MKNVEIRDLHHGLMQVRTLTNGDHKGMTYIHKNEQSKQYCDLLLKLATDLKDYLYHFEIKVEKDLIDSSEIRAIHHFLNELLSFFEGFRFLRGKQQQSWIDMTFLFFGVIVYHKASLRIIKRNAGLTPELMTLSQTFEALEKTVYNKMYYNLTDFRY